MVAGDEQEFQEDPCRDVDRGLRSQRPKLSGGRLERSRDRRPVRRLPALARVAFRTRSETERQWGGKRGGKRREKGTFYFIGTLSRQKWHEIQPNASQKVERPLFRFRSRIETSSAQNF